MQIQVDNPKRPVVMRLLQEHLDEMAAKCPPESIHALGIEALCADEITFWTATEKSALLGCGALLAIDAKHGEIKAMRTAGEHIRKGVGSRILELIVETAQARSYSRLSLETGAMELFVPARAFYRRFGFIYCGPFAGYEPDPNSVFMTLQL